MFITTYAPGASVHAADSALAKITTPNCHVRHAFTKALLGYCHRSDWRAG